MLELINLHFTVSDENGEKHILNGVDLAIPDKRFVVITGPNGGGKTTLARTIMGINRSEYEKQFLLPFDDIEAALEKNRSFGYAAKSEDGRWRLTPKGYLISNSIISDLLIIQENSTQLQRF